jgi:hypothetical protein
MVREAVAHRSRKGLVEPCELRGEGQELAKAREPGSDVPCRDPDPSFAERREGLAEICLGRGEIVPHHERAEPQHDLVGDRTTDRPAEPRRTGRVGAYLELDEEVGGDLAERAGGRSEGRELEIELQVCRFGIGAQES